MHIEPYLELDALYLDDPSLLEKPRRATPPADVVHVIERTRYLFRGEVLRAQEIPLAVGIDSRDWVAAVLTVTVDESKSMAKDSFVDVVVENTFLSEEEPSIVFVEGGYLATARIYAEDAVPQLYTETITQPISPMLRVMLRPQMDAVAGEQDLTLTVTLTGRKS